MTTMCQRLLARAAELGPLSQADLVAALPVCIPAAKALGLSGTAGLACLAGLVQVVAGSLSRQDEAAAACHAWLAALGTADVATALAVHDVDLSAALAGARSAGNDILIAASEAVRRGLAGDIPQAETIFADAAAAATAQALAGNLPLYRSIRDAAMAYAQLADPLVGLRRVLRVGQ